MNTHNDIVETLWDTACLGINTYEIINISDEVLHSALKLHGHFSVKIDPLASKKLLHDNGFYYCDTLLEPYCTPERFVQYKHDKISVVHNLDSDALVEISHGAFIHGRFHRDFNISNHIADLRYDTWLRELNKQHQVMGLMFNKTLAGFLGFSANRILLHALSSSFTGKSLSKYFWSAACTIMFETTRSEIVSSISASNVAVLNLYSSLGFKFRKPLDVYHRIVKE